jgi:2-polyprenyl-3-methyl-5-hydroxy-6-metoxy-1,4-benzoquinol methylase
MRLSEDKTNRQSAAVNTGYYDQLWRTLGQRLHYTELMRAEFIANGIRQYVNSPGLEILDLGCGRGWMASVLSPLGKVTGVDFSPAGIQFAQENYGHHGEFILGDPASETLGLADDRRFDVVVCSEVIEHAEHQPELVRQIKRFLRPRGWLFLTTPNGNVFQQFCTQRKYVHALQPVENWLAPSRLSQMLRAEGFLIAAHEGLPMYECRFRRHRWLQRRLFHRLFIRLGLAKKYGRFILMDALYQVVVARKGD